MIHPLSPWTDEELPIAILSLVADARPYLEGFLSGPVQARHLAWFIRAFLSSEDLGVREVDEWVEDRRAEIDAWLHAGAVSDALVRAIDDPASLPFRWELVLGLEQLRTPEVIPFDRGEHGSWVPEADARARAAGLGVDLGHGRFPAPAD